MTRNKVNGNEVVNTMSTNTVFNTQQFGGDPSDIEYFFDLINNHALINSWDFNTTVLYLKAHLFGPAREFFFNSKCIKAQSVDEIHKLMVEFFSVQPNETDNMIIFQNMAILPNESLNNFAIRLELAAEKAFGDFSDNPAINKIVSLKFLNYVPSYMKSKLVSLNLNNFSNIVKRSQELYRQQSTLLALDQQCNSSSVNAISTNELTEHINALSSKINQISCNYCGGPHLLKFCIEYSSSLKANQQSVPAQSVPPESQCTNVYDVYCVYCGKAGHLMKSCWEYLATQTSSVSQVGENVSLSSVNANPNSNFQRRGNFNRNYRGRGNFNRRGNSNGYKPYHQTNKYRNEYPNQNKDNFNKSKGFRQSRGNYSSCDQRSNYSNKYNKYDNYNKNNRRNHSNSNKSSSYSGDSNNKRCSQGGNPGSSPKNGQ